MKEDLDMIIEMTDEQMKKAISHLESILVKIRTGKANPNILDGIKVDYYGVMSPLNQVANIGSPDPHTIAIQPWEKSMIEPIEKAIMQSNLNLTPHNDGSIIRINMPSLTEERRRELVKQARNEAENCKVSIRGARKEANEEIKKLQKQGLPEDLSKSSETRVQQITDSYTKKTDEHLAVKEKEIMTI